VTQANKRRRDKTAQDFGESLMSYLGRKADRTVSEYTTFQRSLREVVG
jgi:hypothetical protein